MITDIQDEMMGLFDEEFESMVEIDNKLTFFVFYECKNDVVEVMSSK